MSTEKFLSTLSDYSPLSVREEATVAIPVGISSSSSSENGFWGQLLGPSAGRENHLFLGCLCDARRATLILNSMTIVGNICVMLVAWLGVKYIQEHKEEVLSQVDDDQVNQMVDNGIFGLVEVFVDLFLSVSIVWHSFGIYGALKYNTCAIKTAAIAYGISLAYNAFGLQLIPALIHAIFLYPHLVLVKEIESGVMTDYNYENVKACCAC